MKVFDRLESEVRSYCRSFPVVFKHAVGATVTDEEGLEYIDFLAGAGSLNYGHNPPEFKEALLEYIHQDGIIHGLDMATTAKKNFLLAFEKYILSPRDLNYKVQFTGPTGTNAVEAALKLARNATGRTNIISFTNGFHGMTLGALAVTGNNYYREKSGITTIGVNFMPYDGYHECVTNSIDLLEKYLADSSSGVEIPAGIIVETVQGEGGLNVARAEWLQSLRTLCDKYGIVLIFDDIQVGCGRTGRFFSFEDSQVIPDVVTLSKSLSGYGTPFSIVLMKPELDIWKAGQHNGTFRGNNLAFVTATKAIETYWNSSTFEQQIQEKSILLKNRLKLICLENGIPIKNVVGKGLILGIKTNDRELTSQITKHAFSLGLIVESCGAQGDIVKILMPLNISENEFNKGCDILMEAFRLSLNMETLITA